MSRSALLAPSFVMALLLTGTAACAQTMNLMQTRRGLDATAVATRLAAVERLGDIGVAADAQRLQARLSDRNENVRSSATTSMWQIWSRSGDPAIDALLVQGLGEMRARRLEDALAIFDEVVRRKPDFAEGWNRRATVKHLLGRHAEALQDAAEALKRNPIHFGALVTTGESHLALGHRDRALAAFRQALQINPHLGSAAEAVRRLEEPAAKPRRSTS